MTLPNKEEPLLIKEKENYELKTQGILLMNAIERLKPQLEVLEKIKSWETKLELNRFLLVMSFAGFLSIIIGLVEYLFNRFLKIDIVYFQFGVQLDSAISPNVEPLLFISVWLVTLAPIMIMLVFSTGQSGIINWNKTYRVIAILALLLFICAEALILIAGPANSHFIPLIWGFFVFVGFIISAELFYRKEKQSVIRLGLLISGSLALIISILVFSYVEPEIATFLLSTLIGLILVSFSMIIFLIKGKNTYNKE